jgi:hypothetical protein
LVFAEIFYVSVYRERASNGGWWICSKWIVAHPPGEQSNSSCEQGMQGYAKRYDTAYADNAIENFMASALFPSFLHQDPRYYQLGNGGFWRRAEHALGRVLITHSDSGHRRLNYSELSGGFVAAISTYSCHPQSEGGFRNVVSVRGFQRVGCGYMIQEFWPDLRKRSKSRKPDQLAVAVASNCEGAN